MLKFLNETPVLMSKKLQVKSKIRGIAIRSERLYIVQQTSNEIKQYDSKTLKPLHSPMITNIKNPCDMLVQQNDRICVSELEAKLVWSCWGETVPPINLKTECSATTLSETFSGNILVTCPESKYLLEFSVYGILINRINLGPQNITPSHAVQLSTEEYIIADVTKDQYRIVKLDTNGNLVCEYSDKSRLKITPLNMPVYLLRCSNDYILVADHNNGRILMLSSSLELVRELIAPGGVLEKPFRMCLDETNERLYVVDRKQQNKVLIFTLRNTSKGF